MQALEQHAQRFRGIGLMPRADLRHDTLGHAQSEPGGWGSEGANFAGEHRQLLA